MKKLSYILLILLLIACKKENSIPTVNYKVVLSDHMILEETNLKNKIGNTVTFEVKTIFLLKNYVFGNYRQGYLYFDTIEFNNGVDWQYTIDSTSVYYPSVSENNNYSVAFIHDKNMTSGWGDVSYSDGFHYTIKNSIENGNEVLLVGAVRDHLNNPCKFYTESFMQIFEEEEKDKLYNFCSEELNGSPSIYDAIDLTMDKMIDEAIYENKHIVVFWDKEDDGNGTTKEEIIEKANLHNIKISFFKWDHSNQYIYDNLVISEKTGGYFATHNSTSKFQCSLFSLEKILSKNYVNLNFHLKFNSNFSTNYWRDYFVVDEEYPIPFYIEF